MKRFLILICLMTVVLASGSALAAPMKVFVSIAPEKYFVEKIGGNLVDVKIMTPPGANPHTYEPKPQQMVDLSKARVYFAIGVAFENVWLKKFEQINKDMLIVHAESGIVKIPMAPHLRHDDDEGSELDKAHDSPDATPDPHVWTSPLRVMIIAHNIVTALVKIDPANRAAYVKGYQAFISEIQALNADLHKLFQDKKDAKFMVFHPAWGYLAHDYGLDQVPVEIEGKEPKPAQLKKLIERARRENIRVIFVQPQMSTKSADIIAKAIDGQVVFADPLAEDWAQNLKEQVEKFKAALK